MNDLVERLANGKHPVEIDLKPEKTLEALKKRIDLGYLHVKFLKARGGTELGIQLDKQLMDLTAVDFENGSGYLKIVGSLTLDYIKVRCVAEIDLKTLAGEGWLEKLAA